MCLRDWFLLLLLIQLFIFALKVVPETGHLLIFALKVVPETGHFGLEIFDPLCLVFHLTVLKLVDK